MGEQDSLAETMTFERGNRINRNTGKVCVDAAGQQPASKRDEARSGSGDTEAELPGKIVDEAYLSALARMPSDSERTKLAVALDPPDPKQLRAAVEDLYWALLSSKEFLFNH